MGTSQGTQTVRLAFHEPIASKNDARITVIGNVLRKMGRAQEAITALEQAREQVTRLVGRWDDGLAKSIAADNLFLDHRFRPEVETGSASLEPGLFYRFQVGANLEFICIDTSIATGMDVEHYFDDPAHSRWVEETLRGEGARWRIPFSHHPPFCAGPEHGNTTGMVERLVPLFEQTGGMFPELVTRGELSPDTSARA